MMEYFAPGRVNIIGEHVDYSGGWVLPCAIEAGTRAWISLRGDGKILLSSENFTTRTELPAEEITYDPAHDWANYPLGIVRHMQLRGAKIAGFELHFSGNVPAGAGLSSSASISLATAFALNGAFSLGFSTLDLVKIAQESENLFCGVNCGIMDQFAVGFAKKDAAFLLNCATLEYKHVPMNLGDHKLVIMNTNKPRKLGESKYNERRAECEAAFAAFAGFNLSGLTPTAFFANAHIIADEKIRRRAKHFVTENNRVLLAAKALESGDTAALGRLLDESHASLRDDYEVSCHELDTIVSLAKSSPACLGARMTGAGFGGYAIALVAQKEIPRFIGDVSAGYEKIIGYAPTIYNL